MRIFYEESEPTPSAPTRQEMSLRNDTYDVLDEEDGDPPMDLEHADFGTVQPHTVSYFTELEKCINNITGTTDPDEKRKAFRAALLQFIPHKDPTSIQKLLHTGHGIEVSDLHLRQLILAQDDFLLTQAFLADPRFVPADFYRDMADEQVISTFRNNPMDDPPTYMLGTQLNAWHSILHFTKRGVLDRNAPPDFISQSILQLALDGQYMLAELVGKRIASRNAKAIHDTLIPHMKTRKTHSTIIQLAHIKKLGFNELLSSDERTTLLTSAGAVPLDVEVAVEALFCVPQSERQTISIYITSKLLKQMYDKLQQVLAGISSMRARGQSLNDPDYDADLDRLERVQGILELRIARIMDRRVLDSPDGENRRHLIDDPAVAKNEAFENNYYPVYLRQYSKMLKTLAMAIELQKTNQRAGSALRKLKTQIEFV